MSKILDNALIILVITPKDQSVTLESRHLGLVKSVEIDNLVEKIEICTNLIEEHVDLDLIIDNLKEIPKYEDIIYTVEKNLGLEKH